MYGHADVWVTLIRPDVRRPDHLAPLLGFVCDQFSEIGRRAPEDDAAQIGQLGLQLRIGEARIDLRVELVDDRGGRIPWCAEAEKPGGRSCGGRQDRGTGSARDWG